MAFFSRFFCPASYSAMAALDHSRSKNRVVSLAHAIPISRALPSEITGTRREERLAPVATDRLGRRR
jgi:hypothetical protein